MRILQDGSRRPVKWVAVVLLTATGALWGALPDVTRAASEHGSDGSTHRGGSYGPAAPVAVALPPEGRGWVAMRPGVDEIDDDVVEIEIDGTGVARHGR